MPAGFNAFGLDVRMYVCMYVRMYVHKSCVDVFVM
jgi:hypothetical protein